MQDDQADSRLAVPRAVVLVSGGLDSATTLAFARAEGFDCYALSFAYGQRHELELSAAAKVAAAQGAIEHRVVPIDLSAFGGSALTDLSIPVPERDEEDVWVPDLGATETIPLTYVPARNTVFLALALAWAETLDARHIFIGANAVDYSGYPDCRPEFLQAFQHMANLATKVGVEAQRPEDGILIRAPLVDLSKGDIIRAGLALNVDYSLTLSCYQPDTAGRACGRCDSCHLRRAGFVQAEAPDPTIYQ